MGYYERRYFSHGTYRTRPALSDDPPTGIFEAYVPDHITNWAPRLSIWQQGRLERAGDLCREMARNEQAGNAPPAEWLIQRAESAASSTIEGIHPSARRVARAEVRMSLFGQRPRGEEREVVRNIRLTREAQRLADTGTDLDLDGLLALHELLMEGLPIAGRIRRTQNWIGGVLSSPMDALFVPPPPELVSHLLSDLIAYMRYPDGEHPLLRAAIAHAQFETIHPFADGNGRLGRALVQYMLRREGVFMDGSLPVSAALVFQRDRYYAALTEYRVVCAPNEPRRSRGLRPWTDVFLDSVINAVRLRERLNRHVSVLRQRWQERARAARIRLGSTAWRVLDLLPDRPLLAPGDLVEALGATDKTAYRALKQLEKAGILVSRNAGKGRRIYESGDILDAFEEARRPASADALVLHPAPAGVATAVLGIGATCGQPTRRGGACRHPKPAGPFCQAGHPSSAIS